MSYLSAFPALAAKSSNPDKIVLNVFEDMLLEIHALTSGRVIVPAYNYDFTEDGRFDVRSSPSQVGQFSELFRQRFIETRTPVPVFSNTGTTHVGSSLGKTSVIDPFGPQSDFEDLALNGGQIITFGASFAPTYIMYIERQLDGGPIYRYLKEFSGLIVDAQGKSHSVTMPYYVRPLKVPVTYDLPRIERELFDAGILSYRQVRDAFTYSICDCGDFLEYALHQLKDNPFYFLDNDSEKALIESGALKSGRVRRDEDKITK